MYKALAARPTRGDYSSDDGAGWTNDDERNSNQSERRVAVSDRGDAPGLPANMAHRNVRIC